jgi:hypothetical protein
MKVAQSQQIAETPVARPAQATTDSTNGATFQETLDAEITLRKGEEAVAVAGHAYSEITKGAREGMYINTSGNVRHGEAFVLVRKNGKEYHIYGSGKDRLVVGFHTPKADGSAPTTTDRKADVDTPDPKLRKGEEAKPVEGHAYAEITKGAREGMYVNTSGNSRHGEAFVLVRRHGVEYHIYGTGKDREVVALEPRDER